MMRQRTRLLRGRILETLKAYRELPAADVQISQLWAIIGDFDRDSIEAQVAYLIEKQYVADATRRLDHRHRAGVETVRITTEGIDLVEGVTTDDAVEF